jgi:peroxiredoxin
VSVDTVEQNAAMVDKLLLPFPLLADPTGDVIRSYDVWNEGEGGIAKPALFLVRPDSSIAYSFVGSDFADRPLDEDLFAAASGLSPSSPSSPLAPDRSPG